MKNSQTGWSGPKLTGGFWQVITGMLWLPALFGALWAASEGTWVVAGGLVGAVVVVVILVMRGLETEASQRVADRAAVEARMAADAEERRVRELERAKRW